MSKLVKELTIAHQDNTTMMPSLKCLLLKPDFVDLFLGCHINQVSDGYNLVSTRFDWEVPHLLAERNRCLWTPIGASIVFVLPGCIIRQVYNNSPGDRALCCRECTAL